MLDHILMHLELSFFGWLPLDLVKVYYIADKHMRMISKLIQIWWWSLKLSGFIPQKREM